MDIVGGFPLADGTCAKALTGIDDHSRTCLAARLMARPIRRARNLSERPRDSGLDCRSTRSPQWSAPHEISANPLSFK
jgi:hypothetical protein